MNTDAMAASRITQLRLHGNRVRSTAPASTARRISGRASTHIVRSAPPENNESVESADDIQIEQLMASKRKSKKGQAPEPAKPYKVVSAQRDSVYGDQPMSQMQQLETTVVQGLGLLFLLILAEGIFLGASGFMSAEMDQLATDVVYPLFSPTLAVFLAGSSLYGLWKTKEGDGESD